MQQTELMHHGVKGMKWGVRKAPKKKLITAFQAERRAQDAAEAARRKSVAESKASGDKGIGSLARANRKAKAAKRQAYNESIANDKAYNKQARAENKANKERYKAERQQVNAKKRAEIKAALNDANPGKNTLVKAGASVATGILAGNLAGNTVLALTGSMTVARGAQIATAYLTAKSVSETLFDD